jgi:hypothetical protein
MHVISIGLGGESESFVSIPEPATVLLVLASLLVAPLRRR